MASNMHKKFNGMHDAVMNNDHTHMHRLLKKQHTKATRHRHGGKKGKNSGVLKDPLQHDKGRQCQILTGCAKGMSFYDTFVSTNHTII